MRPSLLLVLLLAGFSFQAVAQEEEATEAPSAQVEGLTDEMVEKLSPEQLGEILKAREANESGGAVAWISSLAFFVLLMLTVAGGLAAFVRAHRERQETIRLALEKGVTAAQLFPVRSPIEDLRRGILLIAIGVGTALVVAFVSPDKSWASVGLLPIVLGAGFLVSYRVSKPPVVADVAAA